MSEVAGPRSLRQLLDAVVTIGSDLDLPVMLHRIAHSATELVDARYGALGVLDESGTRLAQFITVGIDDDIHRAIGHLPEGHGILGLLIVDAQPLRLPDLTEHPDSYGFPPNHPPMRSFLGVPIRVRDEVFGNLYLTDKMSAEVFTDVDEELAVGLAGAAAVAIDNARLHARVQELALVTDRERIARDLHDTVIQRLFVTGLSLQGTARLVRSDPATTETRIEAAVDDLDLTVKHIRSAIFGLESTRIGGPGLRDSALSLLREAAGALGFEPKILFDGEVDTSIPEEVATELLATLREALSNVARHAGASKVDVSLTVNGEVLLRVVDDGVGPSAPGTPPTADAEGPSPHLGDPGPRAGHPPSGGPGAPRSLHHRHHAWHLQPRVTNAPRRGSRADRRARAPFGTASQGESLNRRSHRRVRRARRRLSVRRTGEIHRLSRGRTRPTPLKP